MTNRNDLIETIGYFIHALECATLSSREHVEIEYRQARWLQSVLQECRAALSSPVLPEDVESRIRALRSSRYMNDQVTADMLERLSWQLEYCSKDSIRIQHERNDLKQQCAQLESKNHGLTQTIEGQKIDIKGLLQRVAELKEKGEVT